MQGCASVVLVFDRRARASLGLMMYEALAAGLEAMRFTRVAKVEAASWPVNINGQLNEAMLAGRSPWLVALSGATVLLITRTRFGMPPKCVPRASVQVCSFLTLL